MTVDHPETARTWLVTGATGFLGANIGAFLSGRARRVGAVRARAAPSALFDQYVADDLRQPDHLIATIEQSRPDVVLHAAALASHSACEADPELAHLVNVEMSVRLARAARAAGAQFVFISTDAVFDGTRGSYRESDDARPTSVYGRTKLEAEQQVAEVGDALIVRTNFFGWSPSGTRSILEFFARSMRHGDRVPGFTDFTTSSAYAQVLAEVLWDLVALNATGTFHVTSPDTMTKYAFGVAVAEAFGLDQGLITPARADIEPPRTGDISLDVSKVQALLGRSLPTMRAGIERARQDESVLGSLIRGAAL